MIRMLEIVAKVSVNLLLMVLIARVIVAFTDKFSISREIPIIAFLLPFSLFFIDQYGFNLLPVLPDAITFHELALETSLEWRQGNFLEISGSNLRVQSYVFLLSIIYILSGNFMAMGVMVNCFFWALSIIYWLRTGAIVLDLDSNEQYLAGLFLVLSPAANLYVAHLLRESISLFLLSVLVYYFASYSSGSDSGHKIRILVILISSLLLMALRPEIALVCLISIAIVHTYNNFKLGYILIWVMTMLGVVVIGGRTLSGYLNPFSIDFIEGVRTARADLPNSYLVNRSYDTWFDVILYLPAGIFHLLFQPFPWYTENYSLLIATVDAIYLIVLCMLSLLSLYHIYNARKPELAFLIVLVTILLVGYSIIVSAQAPAGRRRLYIVPILCLLAVPRLPGLQIIISNNKLLRDYLD